MVEVVADGADPGPVVELLTRAFHDDPISVWLFPNPADRVVRHRAIFGGLLGGLPAGGRVTVVGAEAAAVWMPVAAPDDDSVDAVALVGADAAQRFGPLRELMSRSHPTEPHEYLPFVGVDPTAQGRGLGGELLRHRLAELDRAGVPAYLEASSPRSARLYARHGFVARPEITVPGGPPLHPMWRDPA